MRSLSARVACAVALFFAVAAHADPVVNGSFEDPHVSYLYVNGGQSTITGWQTILSGVELFDPHIYSAGAAEDGSQILDLNTDFAVGGGIKQTFSTNVGTLYVLSFYGGTWLGAGRNGTGHIEVTVNSVPSSFTVTNLTSTINWTHLSLTFFATSTTTTIAFQNFDNPNTTFSLLDNVSLEGITIPNPDSDGDGVNDDHDNCPNSNLGSTVVIDGCDSGVPNSVSATGCSVSDLLAGCAAGAASHGDYVSCVAGVTNDLKDQGIISGQQKGAIQSCAAKANIP